MAADDARREPAASSRARSPGVPLLLAVQLVTGVVLAPVFTFFPVYLKEIGFSVVLISVIATLQRVMSLGSSLVGGTLVDTIGTKRILVAGQVLYFAGTLLFLSRDSWWIALVWAVCGIGMGPVSLASTSYLIEKADRARLGLFTALLYWGITLGGAIGNPLAAALLGRTGWKGLVPFTAIPAVGIVAATAFALPGSMRRDPAAARPPGLLSAVALAAASPPIRLLVWMRFLPTVCYGTLLVFVPLLLKDAGASNAAIALYGTAVSVCASLAQLAVGRLADRTGWKGPTAASFAALAVAAFVIAALPNQLWVVFAGGTLAMSAAWSLSTLLPIQMMKAVEPSEIGRVLGAIQLFWNVAMILAGLAGGVLFVAWNGLPFLVGGLAAAAGLPVAAVYATMAGSGAGRDPAVSGPSRPPSGDRAGG
jgi:PPP family 3-phenylpropionic acid transporter